MIINSVFVALWGRGEDYKDLDEIGANHFILSESRINRENIKQFNKLKRIQPEAGRFAAPPLTFSALAVGVAGLGRKKY